MIGGSGWMGRPITALAALIAASTNFQSWVGAANANAALASIHAPLTDDRAGEYDPRPRAIISWNELVVGVKGSACQFGDGDLSLSFEADPDPTVTTGPTDQFVDFCNKFSAVMQDMLNLSGMNLTDGSGVYLNLRQMILIEGPGPTVPDEENGEFFYGVTFLVKWIG